MYCHETGLESDYALRIVVHHHSCIESDEGAITVLATSLHGMGSPFLKRAQGGVQPEFASSVPERVLDIHSEIRESLQRSEDINHCSLNKR